MIKKLFRTIFVLSLFMAASMAAALAQRLSVSGYVTESSSGEPVIGAAVVEHKSGLWAVTNNFGYYTISLPPGDVTLNFSCLGYTPFETAFSLQRDTTLQVSLATASESLAGATVTASRSESGVRGTQMSAIEVPVSLIRSVPAIAGEADVIKALQLLPGVQSGSEGSAGMYIRGGGPDENLILLDGVPLYNVNHMLGFFSAFDPEAVKNVTLYKGSFPARFGSRLSGVVDVRLKDGNDQEICGSASVGLISARVNVEGPIVKEKTTFNFSLRRTYYDILAAPIIYMIGRSNDIDKATAGYYFYDASLKLTHKLSPSDKLFASFYIGDDSVYAGVRQSATYSGNVTETMKTNLGWKWGNMVAAFRWNHIVSPRLFLNTTLNYTRYKHNLGLKLSYDTKEIGDRQKLEQNVDFNSYIGDISVGTDAEYSPSPDHEIRFGGQYTYHNFNPAVTSISLKVTGSHTEIPIDTAVGSSPLRTHEAAFYAEDNIRLTDHLKANLGLRGSIYGVKDRTFFSLEPRLSLRLLITGDLSLKASYTEMSQYIHLLSSTNVSLPTDLWVPVTGDISPMRSRQYAAGIFYSYGGFDFSIEGYSKSMNNVLEYMDGATFIGSTAGWEKKVVMGRARSKGVEFLIQKQAGATTGWIGYTLARSERIFDRDGNILNSGNPFPAKYDRRHDLSIVLSQQITKRIDVSGTFVYGSGTCGSLATSVAVAPGDAPWGWRDLSTSITGGEPVDLLDSRNNFRLPAYHRMDIGINFHRPRRHGHRTISLSVYNLYNRQNPYLVYLDSRTIYENDIAYTQPVLKQLSIFPIMPSLSYTYKF